MKKLNTGGQSTLVAALTMFVLMTGCATTQSTDGGETDADPLEAVNRPIYMANDFIDEAIGEPVATTYIEYTPDSVRKSVSNFFDNVSYPNTILNSFLQGKGNQGFHDVGRFVVNSTFGLLGIWDMATPLGLEAHTEDFGQTLYLWGVRDDPYMVLPFLGPNTITNSLDLGISTVTNVLFYAGAPFIVPVAVLGLVDKRARADEAVRFRDKAAVEPYLFTREAYRQHRRFLTYDGDPPIEDDELLDEALIDLEDDETPLPQDEPGRP